MFEIEYKGGNGVVVSTKKTTLVVDPKLSVVGLKDMPVKDAVELATEQRFAVGSPDASLLIDGPGEYEVGDFIIKGTAARRHIDQEAAEKLSTIYRIECGEVRIGIVGNIAPELDEEQEEAIGVIDILVIPVGGGGYTLDATSAATLVRQLSPSLVLPVHYADSGLKYEVPQDTLETFVSELGAPVEKESKLKIKSAASLPETLTVFEVARS